MGIYWIISLSLTALSILDLLLSNNKKSSWIRIYFYIFATALIFTFGGMRQLGTGLDDGQYRQFYDAFINKLNIEGFWHTAEDFRYEPAIYAIALFSRLFTKNSDFFIYLFCMISVCVNSFYFRKLTPLPMIALAVYSAHLFINKDMNQIRFGLCSAFLLGFVYHTIKKNKLGMLRLFLLSFFSHATGIVAILIPMVLFFKKNKYLPILIVVGSLPLAFMGSSALLAGVSSHIGSLGDRAMAYSGQDSAQEQGVFTLSNLKNIGFVVLFSFMLLSDKMKRETPEKFSFYYVIAVTFALGCGLRLALQDYASGGRLANYLLQVEPVLISLCVYEARKFKKVLAVMVTVLMVLYYLYYNTVASKQSITGYGVSQSFKIIR